MLSVLAELQRELIVANTNDGLASARTRGRVGGRWPKLTPDQAALAQQLYDAQEKTVQQIADLISRQSAAARALGRRPEFSVPQDPQDRP
jgi:DNA invertase Pin-like site-specific DNA recombinase